MLRFVITIFITIIMEGKKKILENILMKKRFLSEENRAWIYGKNYRNYNIGIESLIYILL